MILTTNIELFLKRIKTINGKIINHGGWNVIPNEKN